MSFEDTVRAAVDRVVSDVREKLEAELGARVDELVAAAAAERALAASHAADAAAADVRRQASIQLEQFRDAARNRTDELRRAADAETADWKRRIDELRRTHQEEIDAILQTSHVEIDDARRMAAAQVEDVQREFEQRLEHLQSEIETLRREAADQVRTEAQRLAASDSTRLGDGLRAIDAGRSLADVLDALAQAAGAEVDRAALFIVRGERLHGWRWSGFGLAPSPKSIELTFERAGIAGDAVRRRAATRWSRLDERDDARLPDLAASTPVAAHESPVADGERPVREALAFPVMVGGAPVAVLYADTALDDGPTSSSRRTGTLHALVRYAGRALEAMTVQQATGPMLARAVARASQTAPPRLRDDDSVAGERRDADGDEALPTAVHS